MLSRFTYGWFAAAALSLAASVPVAPQVTPVPADPLEIVSGPIQIAATPQSRAAALELLQRARANYTLRSAGRAYDLNVTFTVNSGGQTEHDGVWQMEDIFDPHQGLRWTATASDAYVINQISSRKVTYSDSAATYIPLRLQEARAALFDSIPPLQNIDRQTIRTTTSTFHGAVVACVLLSPGTAPTTAGRSWEESEDCIDPQSGLLQTHSQVPGRYYAYDYSSAVGLNGHLLPSKVVVTEAGRTVSEISLTSLAELPAADPKLFVPTDQMKSLGRPVVMAGAQKISRNHGSGSADHPVCVFGLATPSGTLVEAHSLQPSDPNSQAALEAASKLRFSQPVPGGPPQQHFVFIIENFYR